MAAERKYLDTDWTLDDFVTNLELLYLALSRYPYIYTVPSKYFNILYIYILTRKCHPQVEALYIRTYTV